MLLPYIFFHFALVSASTQPSEAQAQLLLTRVGQCLGNKYKESLVRFSEISVIRNDAKYYLSGFVYVKEDVPNGWSIRATKQKCGDIRDLDTCDFLCTFPVVSFACGADEAGGGADGAGGGGAAVRGLFKHTEPRMSCPVKAGIYKLDNYSLVMRRSYFDAAEAKISTSMFGYTLMMEGYDEEDSRILCAELYLQLTYTRRSPHVVQIEEDLYDGGLTTEDPEYITTTGEKR